MDPSIASLAVVLVFAGVYLAGAWIESSPRIERFRTHSGYISAAAGISVAYVFIDVLPELEVQRQAMVGAAGNVELLFAEKRVYLGALLSFVVVYGLEHMVLVTHERRRAVMAEGRADAVYWVEVAGYAAYTGLIGYLVLDRTKHGVLSLAIYAFAMAIHFLIVDHGLAEKLGSAYAPRGRWVLAASVLVGWGVAVAMPLSDTVVARLFAVLAGGVVMASLRAELPHQGQGQFWPFCLSAVVFAVFLAFAH
jgi:hypothetical protein